MTLFNLNVTPKEPPAHASECVCRELPALKKVGAVHGPGLWEQCGVWSTQGLHGISVDEVLLSALLKVGLEPRPRRAPDGVYISDKCKRRRRQRPPV
jgi:hypothetical protein